MYLSHFVEEINQATVGIPISFPNKMNGIILPVIFWLKNIKDSICVLGQGSSIKEEILQSREVIIMKIRERKQTGILFLIKIELDPIDLRFQMTFLTLLSRVRTYKNSSKEFTSNT